MGAIRGQDRAVVVPVGHDNAADHRVDTPRRSGGDGCRVLSLPVKVMSKARAKPSPGGWCPTGGLVVVHHALHSVGLLGAVEFFPCRSLPLDHRHGQNIFRSRRRCSASAGLSPGLLGVGVHGVALTPGNSRWRRKGREFSPSGGRTPLVVELGAGPGGSG